MAKKIWQCEGCPKTYPTELEADKCNEGHIPKVVSLVEQSIQRLTDKIHNALCIHDHIDSCGYEYETWKDPGHSKKEWFPRGQKLHNFLKKFKIPEKEAASLIGIFSRY